MFLLADNHACNDSLTVTELRSSLDMDPFRCFVGWLTGDRLRHFGKHDANSNGSIDREELRAAWRYECVML